MPNDKVMIAMVTLMASATTLPEGKCAGEGQHMGKDSNH
jgi:hypothetical protein